MLYIISLSLTLCECNMANQTPKLILLASICLIMQIVLLVS